jgi:hypothetical protein
MGSSKALGLGARSPLSPPDAHRALQASLTVPQVFTCAQPGYVLLSENSNMEELKTSRRTTGTKKAKKDVKIWVIKLERKAGAV